MLRQRSEQKGRKAFSGIHGTGLPQVGQPTTRGAEVWVTRLQVAEGKNETARKPNTGAAFRFHGFLWLLTWLLKKALLGAGRGYFTTPLAAPYD